MRVLIPVMTCGVRYQVSEGRPYSYFERTLLEAVECGICTLDALVDALGVNRSLVVHGMVTLVEAGWIALTSLKEQPYVLTNLGRVAVSGEELPDTFKLSPEKQATVVVERIWGNVCSLRDTRYIQDAEEIDGDWVKLTPEMSEPPDPSDVRRFLFVDEGRNQRVYSIGGVSVRRVGRDWIPAVVAEDNKGIFGIPRHWLRDTRLVSDIQDAAYQLREQIREDEDVSLATNGSAFEYSANAEDQSNLPSHFVGPDEISVLVGEEHDDCLEKILDESQQGDFVIIHSETIDQEQYSRVARSLQRALIGGVNVDVLWGKKSDGHFAAMAMLKELERASLSEVPGRLLVAQAGTRLLANVVLAGGAKTVLAIVGTHRWLDQSRGKTLSIRTSNKNLVSEICDQFSPIVAEHVRPSYNSQRLEWQARQATTTDPSPDSVEVGIVQGGRFLAVLNDWLDEASDETITFGMREWPKDTESSLLNRLYEIRESSGSVRVLSGAPEAREMAVLAELREAGFEVRRDELLYSEFVRFGESAAIVGSGLLWLDRAQRGPNANRTGYGLWVKDKSLVAKMDERLNT